jgi:hypothetical protein
VAGATAVMVLAIWIAARVGQFYPDQWVFVWTLGGLAGAAVFSRILCLVRQASLARIAGGGIMGLWFLARFVFVPAAFLLGIVTLIARMTNLSVTNTLLLATIYVTAYGALAILLTSILADVAAAIRGPDREPPADA